MDKITLKRECPVCGNVRYMTFDKKQYEEGMQKYNAGALIQNAFPNFNPDQREFILTGICASCWG